MKKNNYGIIGLILIMIVGLFFAYDYYNKHKDDNKPTFITEEKKIEHSDEEIKELYEKVNIDYVKEYAFLEKDSTKLNGLYKSNEFSDELKITLGLINTKKEDLGIDYGYRVNYSNLGFKYTGNYIKSTRIKEQISYVLGSGVTYNDKTVVYRNQMYVYDPTIKAYRIFEKSYNDNIKKVSYIESNWDETHIYIDEYAAYTFDAYQRKNSFSRHQNPLPIGITDENIKENLDIIDHYKYTFTYSKMTDNYYLTSIEYIK